RRRRRRPEGRCGARRGGRRRARTGPARGVQEAAGGPLRLRAPADRIHPAGAEDVAPRTLATRRRMTQDQVIFLIGAPRSGTTLLARMLSAHSAVYGRAEPHLITPIAHLGYYAKVDKAPYDQNNVDQAIHEFVADLPRGEADYLDALRAYTDTLYERMLATAPGKRMFLDKTPAYSLVLPFLAKLYPQAKYIVLTRHPFAVLSSYVESFFDGDYQVAMAHNPVLQRYVPALAWMLREKPVPFVHVKYEELVREPEAHFRRICDHLGIPFEEKAIAYGESGEEFKGLGDPTGVARHTRPVTSSVSKWAAEIA